MSKVLTRIHWRPVDGTTLSFVDIESLYTAAGGDRAKFIKWLNPKIARLTSGRDFTRRSHSGSIVYLVQTDIALKIARECGYIEGEPEIIGGDPAQLEFTPRIVGATQAASVSVVPVVHSLPSISDGMIGDDLVQIVDAMALHEFLGGGVKFYLWVEDRLIPFVDGRDYVSDGSRVSLTLDTAKRISMMERTRKGDEVRDYFIRCEKKMRRMEADAVADLNDPRTLRNLLAGYSDRLIASEEKAKTLECKVEEDKPRIEFVRQFHEADKLHGLQEASRTFGLKPNELPALLREHNILTRRGGKNFPYAPYLNRGLFEVKLADPNNSKSTNTYITAAGMEWIGKSIIKWRDRVNEAA